MSTFTQHVRKLYAAHDHNIQPYVGAAFERPSDEDLRVVIVGINSYVSAKHWHSVRNGSAEGWFAGWFQSSEHRFFRVARRSSDALIGGLSAPNWLLHGRLHHGAASYYATNAIKSYVPESDGKKANQIAKSTFGSHAATWRAELDLMARFDVLPDLIVVFGRPFWPHACDSFRPSEVRPFNHLRVLDYQHAPGPCLHFVNRLCLAGRTSKRDVLLVRMRHPSARTARGSVEWLLAQPDFLRLAAKAR